MERRQGIKERKEEGKRGREEERRKDVGREDEEKIQNKEDNYKQIPVIKQTRKKS